MALDSACLWIRETYINKTEGYRYGEGDVYETRHTNQGDLYRALVEDYGRCTGRVYVDTDDGAQAIGWVFVKRAHYDDTFLQETWVTVHEKAPTKIVQYHYANLTTNTRRL